MKAGKIVNESILGEDFKTVLINGKAYTIYPPTIHRIAGAAKCLSDIGEEVKNGRIYRILKQYGMRG